MPDDLTPWDACELPYRPVDDATVWHDDCEPCARRRRLAPTGGPLPTRPTPAAVDRALARRAAGNPLPGDPDRLRRAKAWADEDGRPHKARVVVREPSNLADRVRQAIDDLEATLEQIEVDGTLRPAVDHATNRMRHARPGPVALAYDGSRHRRGESKPPSADGVDVGGAALKEVNTLDRKVTSAARDLRRKVTGWLPHAPTPGIRAEVAAEAAPECAHTRALLHKHEPAYRTGDVGGILEHPMTLCRWVYDFTAKTERLPTRDELERHDRGLKVHIRAS